MAKPEFKYLPVLLALSLVAGLPAQAKDVTMIILEVAGDPGADFSGDCRLYSKAGPEKRYRINGKVPAKYWIPADAVRCSIEKSNIAHRLAAKISKNKAVQLQQVSPPPLRWLTVSSSGPWGKASGMSSTARPLWQ